jgi:carboxyl-terminal processing protease
MLEYAGRRWGELRVDAFRTGTARMLGRELRRLQRDGAAGIVLDLRGNPGGVLREAVATASLFLDGGAVVTLRGLHLPEETLRARRGLASRLPVVVLVDHETASSAEVVAGALRDRHRAEIVGRRTYGKALVQSVDPLGDGGALELTVAHYYTPDGADISGVGLRPDVPASDRPGTSADEALAAALHTLARPAS